MTMSKMKNLVVLALCLCLTGVLHFLNPRNADARILKLALVLPEGSAGVVKIRELTARLKKDTDGEVDAKIYAGGVAGDEFDVLRKMRVNRIQAAAFSSIGLRQILPKITLFEVPGLFQTYGELDYVREKLYDEFEKDFDRQGYTLLGLAEVGFTYFFMQKEVHQPDDFLALKMWSWKGDEAMQRFIENFQIPVVPLHIVDVRMGLQTGMIDAVMSPPMAVNAFQWYANLRYMFDLPLLNVAGALVMNKAEFQNYSPKSQAVMKDALRKYTMEWVRLIRQDNDDALKAIQDFGVRLTPPRDEYMEVFNANFKRIEDEMITRGIVEKTDIERVKGMITEYRASLPRAAK